MEGRYFVVFLILQTTVFFSKAVGQEDCDTQGAGPCVFCQEGDLSSYHGSLSCIIDDVASVPNCLLREVTSLDILGRQDGSPTQGYPDILPASGLTPPTRTRAKLQHILQQDPPNDNCTFFSQFDPSNYTISALVLYLNSSGTAEFPQDLLRDLPTKHLVIEGLQMQAPPPMKGLSSLKTIRMARNGIQTLNLTNVKGLAEVSSIKLTGNVLERIPFHAFARSSLVQLEDLMLDSNKISVIDEDAFAALPSLKVLDLNGNMIQTLNKEILHQLEYLEKLNLSNNAIHTLKAETFSEMKVLHVLDLSQNNLTLMAETPALSFTGPENLTSLYLAQNLITSCPEDLGTALPYLQHLHLQKNNISVFTERFLKGLGSLKEIDLSGNPFSCTCDMEWLFDWFRENGTLAFVNWKEYECYYPRHSRGVNFEHFNPEVLKCDEGADHTHLGLSLGISLTLAVLVIVLAAVLYYHCRWRIKYGWFVLCGKKGEQVEQKVEDEYFKYEAFLSYCSNDRWWVIDELLPKVENCPPPTYKMCLDIRDFEDGPKDQNNIIAAMDESRKTMFVISSSFLRSKRCLWELEMSRNKRYGKTRDDLIFVILETVPQAKMPKLLQKVMMGRKYLRWPEDPRQRDAFWQCLRESFKTNIFKRHGNRIEMQQI